MNTMQERVEKSKAKFLNNKTFFNKAVLAYKLKDDADCDNLAGFVGLERNEVLAFITCVEKPTWEIIEAENRHLLMCFTPLGALVYDAFVFAEKE